MAYLTCIGGNGAVALNKYGAGARGYWLFRRENVVVVRYGAIAVERGTGVQFVWLWLREAPPKRERSVEAAKARLRALIAQKTSPAHGYTRLPAGTKIWPRRRRG